MPANADTARGGQELRPAASYVHGPAILACLFVHISFLFPVVYRGIGETFFSLLRLIPCNDFAHTHTHTRVLILSAYISVYAIKKFEVHVLGDYISEQVMRKTYRYEAGFSAWVRTVDKK